MKSVRRAMTETDKAELWRRWGGGENLSAIARAVGRRESTLLGVIAPCGGIRPAQRRRAETQLSLAEREEISRSLCAGVARACIARRLGRSRSTVSREINRNGGPEKYR